MAVDPVLQSAGELARAVLLEAADAASVGDALGVREDADRVASHLFACTKPGYVGWYWAVSLTRAPERDDVTVNDVLLLPGDEAIVAPAWTPYKDRLQPGDLSPGDVLPPEPDDVRLVPSWSAGDVDDSPADHPEDRAVAREVGLGRPLVLSLEGREQAADRWLKGDQGPDTPLAKQAPGVCRTCGFMVRMAGPLALSFGVCANGMANDDGRVVSHVHGCGAHSGAKLGRSAAPQKLPPHVVDTLTPDAVDAF